MSTSTPKRSNRKSPSSSHKNASKSSKGIIIFGDWIIDEYWFLARQQSNTSSFVGFDHFKISSSSGDIIAALCGAGSTARTVAVRDSAGAARGDHSQSAIFGYGLWNSAQTEAIHDLLNKNESGHHFANANFGGKFDLRKCPPNIKAETLANDADTIKTVRLYKYQDVELDQLSRIDWDRSNHATKTSAAVNTLKGLSHPQINAIVIHDLAKGAVNPETVSALLQMFPHADWYVRSKSAAPAWLENAEVQKRLMLNVAGPETTTNHDPWGNWSKDGNPTLTAIEYLKNMKGRVRCVISNKHEVVIRSDLLNRCIVANSGARLTLLSQLGWSTTFFSCFAHEMIINSNEPPKDHRDAEAAIASLVSFADTESRLVVPRKYPSIKPEPARAVAYDWDIVSSQWNSAFDGLGLIEDASAPNSPKELQLWRATTLLNNYVVCVREKKALIRRIGTILTEFKKVQNPAVSVGILLEADPGAGKSSLVNSLAKTLGYSVVQKNITQMLHREELLDIFDEVATRQATDTRTISNHKPLLVFVDEINAKLQAEHVFSAFLAPLEDGAYMRQGRRISLRPCVWMFVGTANKEGQIEKYSPADKYDDFVSRMTSHERMDYLSLKDKYFNKRGDQGPSILEAEARLEQVYLGVALLRANHPDLAHVERQVLQTFFDLDPSSNPARLIRRRASSLRNVQNEIVTKENCSTWPKHSEIKWNDDRSSVSIV